MDTLLLCHNHLIKLKYYKRTEINTNWDESVLFGSHCAKYFNWETKDAKHKDIKYERNSKLVKSSWRKEFRDNNWKHSIRFLQFTRLETPLVVSTMHLCVSMCMLYAGVCIPRKRVDHRILQGPAARKEREARGAIWGGEMVLELYLGHLSQHSVSCSTSAL